MGDTLTLADINQLFRSCGTDLRRFLARRVPTPEAAADIAQDAFLRMVQLTAGTRIADPRAYLFRTAANLAINHNRHDRCLPTVTDAEAVIAALADPSPNADRLLEDRHALSRLADAIDNLPSRRREVFRLYAVEQWAAGEIAQHLGISRNMVERHIRKALAQCLQEVTE